MHGTMSWVVSCLLFTWCGEACIQRKVARCAPFFTYNIKEAWSIMMSLLLIRKLPFWVGGRRTEYVPCARLHLCEFLVDHGIGAMVKMFDVWRYFFLGVFWQMLLIRWKVYYFKEFCQLPVCRTVVARYWHWLVFTWARCKMIGAA